MKNKQSKKELTRLILTALVLAGGSFYGPVAEAAPITITSDNDKSTLEANGTLAVGTNYVYSKNENSPIVINGVHSDLTGYSFYGGSDVGVQPTSYTITLNGGTVNYLYGFKTSTNAVSSQNNKVYIHGGTVTHEVYGGWGMGHRDGDDANTVEINPTSGKVTISGNIYGSYNASVDTSGNASGNTVTISGNKEDISIGNSVIYGGYCSNNAEAKNNTININSGVTLYGIVGGQRNNKSYYSFSSDKGNNTLNLGASGISVTGDGTINSKPSGVRGFETIAITNGVNFSKDSTVLSVTYKIFSDGTSNGDGTFLPTLDITGATGLTGLTSTSNKLGTMTLISAANSLANMKLKYSSAAAAVIPTTGVKVNSDTSTHYSTANNIKFDYTYDHTVKLANSNKSIQYSIANNVTKVTPDGSIAWSNGGTVRNLTDTTYTFGSGTAIDMSNLTFTSTAVDHNPLSESMTLLSGATGITGGSITLPSTGKGTVAANFTDTAGINFVGTAKGTVSVGTGTNAGKVLYTLNSGTLTSIDLGNWGGTASNIPTNWTGSNVAVTAEEFATEPTGNVDIFTTNTENFFNDTYITGAKKYQGGETLVNDTAKGVTLTGYKGGGVKATDSGKKLSYFKELMDTQSITLGEMTWGQGRTPASGYNFANLTSINATGLTFTNPVAATGTMDLLSNATDLSTTGTYTISGTPHSQNFNNASVDNGAALSGTLTGTISVPATGTVRYTLTNKELKGVNLAKWDSTKNAYALNSEWISGLGANTINASGFTAPTLTAGTSKEIITATSAIFDDDQIYGDQKYGTSAGQSTDEAKGITFTGSQEKGVKASDDKKSLVYAAGDFSVTGISLGEMTAGIPRAITSGYDFSGVTSINASGLTFTNPGAVTGTVQLLTGATNLSASTPVTGGSLTQSISNAAIGNGITGSGTLSGEVTAVAAGINYTAGSKTLSKVNLSNWNGTTTAAPSGWTSAASGIAVDTGTFAAPSDMNPGDTRNVLTAPDGGTFSSITGDRVYKNNESFKDPSNNGVTLEGTRSGGVQITDNDTKLTYTGLQNNVSKITLGTITSTPAAFGNEYSFTNVASVDASGLSFSNPENIGNGDNVTLFTSANSSLTPSTSSTDKDVSYSTTPITGVTISGQITGSYSNTNNTMTYSATANNAQKLTFGNVEWKDTGALIDHSATLTKVNFDGASVDTSNINFTNIQELEANKQMTLVSNFGGTPGTITGSKYKVGSTLQGEGKASMDGDNLIFTADTTAEKMQVQEQTHNTLMGASSSMASLSQGNEFIGTTFDEMFLGANVGRDGIASYAHIGGGSMRQETGSHVNTRTWNAIVALGHRNKKPRNSFEYGAFLEYGTGNYTTYNGDERGDGSARYVGGGLLAKWINPSGLYVEGSLRVGSIHDDGYNLLRDAAGVPYSYNTDTPYYGFHLGVGKQIPMKGGSVLDVYARYFYNHRNSTSFDAGGHYDLDGITSQIIRVGARYTVKRDKWNYYGGLAYEHELDGKAGGWADGMPIRGVDTGGGSFRAELGATVTPNEDIPLTLDFHLTGFAGKKQGLFGGMGLKFNF